MPNIIDAMIDANPWWKGKFIVGFKERDIYKQIQTFMQLPQILAFTGLRRAGKTTIMLKAAEDSINSGLDPRNVLYFSFDEFKNIEIRSVINEYEALMEKDLRNGRYLLLLDEVQKLNDWENQVKTIYDVFGKNIKIMISGSESLFIKMKLKETLAGRIFEFKVEPLTFKEFLGFKGTEYTPVGLHEKELARLFAEFTMTLGFPELVGVKEKEVIRKYVKEGIVDKIVYRDIPELFKVKDTSIIASLLNILMEEPGQMIRISELASDLKISRQTLSAYLTYLEDSFLVRKLYNFSRNRRKVERKLKKYYPTILSVDLLFKEDELSRSKVFESLVVNQLKAEFFWRDPYKNEVDVVLADKNPIPIEIKYGKPSFEGISSFMSKFGAEEGCIISSSLEEKRKIDGKAISIIPAFKFLLK